MRPEDFDIQKIIDSLQGTINTIQSALDDHYPGMDEEDMTEADHQALDDQIFLCTTCGWWCEISQSTESADGEHECDECNPEDDEEEEEDED